ncbi:MAG: DUF4270 family protein, partial [Cyclobacteriaceae bacterium]|nr:DUF4270 family protein [Cyclobacteriaceae bacterium]
IAAFEGYDSSNLITSTKMATLADLGVAQFNVKPVGNGPYGDTVRVRLDNSYMSTVFDSLKNFNLDFGRGFINSFQGIALIPEAGNDAVLGINAKSTGSMLSFYYSTPGDTENSSIDIPFGSGRHSYITPNHLENFRAGTVLDGLAEFYTNFDPGNDRVYFQSGTGVRVNLDMSSLISIGDTLQNIMVNSAILEISNLENTSPTLFPSGSIELFLSDETNEWLSFANVRRKIYGRNRSDSTSLMRQNPNTLTAERLLYFKKENALKADITMYVQNVMENKSDLLNIILEDEQAGGNISRFSTRKSDIKVKVYYTVKK